MKTTISSGRITVCVGGKIIAIGGLFDVVVVVIVVVVVVVVVDVVVVEEVVDV